MPKKTGDNPFTYPLRGRPEESRPLGAIVGLLDNEGWYEWKVNKYREDCGASPGDICTDSRLPAMRMGGSSIVRPLSCESLSVCW